MNPTFAICAALFLLFAAASCAPTGLQDACADVRSSSLALNRVAKIVSVKARNGSKDVTNFSTSLVWMEAKDMCDPETLKQEPATCIGKILSVLTSYKAAVERVSGFQSCSALAVEVTPAMEKLQGDMSKCVNSRGGMNHKKDVSNEATQPIARWQEALLCQYTMDRLFSFSILTARVFAVGDPAHHSESSAHPCKA